MLTKHHKIELACSKTHDTRFSTDHVCIEPDGTAVATDGRILAKIETDLHPETPTLVTQATMKQLEKIGGKFDSADVVLSDGTRIPAPKDCPEFPCWRNVMPDPADSNLRVSLNAELLWRLVQAMGTRGNEAKFGITLHLNTDGAKNGAIVRSLRVTTLDQDGANIGVILPLAPSQK